MYFRGCTYDSVSFPNRRHKHYMGNKSISVVTPLELLPYPSPLFTSNYEGSSNEVIIEVHELHSEGCSYF